MCAIKHHSSFILIMACQAAKQELDNELANI